MPRYPSFIGGSYTSQSSIAANEQTINFYPESVQAETVKDRRVLYPTPGVDVYAAAGADSPGRALFTQGGRVFGIIGATLWEFFAGGARTSRGTVVADLRPAVITATGDGGNQLGLTSGDHYYVYDLTANTLTGVLSSGASQCAMLDGYVLILDAATSTFYASDLLDASTVQTGIMFAQRSLAPDPWQALIVPNRREILLLGTETSEYWYDDGSQPFPFKPHPSGLIQFGIGAPASVTAVGGAAAWVARTAHGLGPVVMASGFEPQVISTYAVETAMRTMARVDDAVGWSYSDAGHLFYVLTFPSAQQTWVYDLAERTWHERGTWIAEEHRYDAWHPQFHAYAFGQHLVLDRSGGALHRLTPDAAWDVDGRPIRRLRRAPGLASENRRLGFPSFELMLEPGLGTVSGPGCDPQVELRYSNNGGKTWASAGLRSAGRIGEYDHAVRWNRLGSGRDRVFEVVMSDPIPWRLIDAYLGNRTRRAA